MHYKAIKAKPVYEEALRKSGYSEGIQYQAQERNHNVRKRKVIWFNPLYNESVKTNIGKAFIGIVEKHFPVHHKFRKIFN